MRFALVNTLFLVIAGLAALAAQRRLSQRDATRPTLRSFSVTVAVLFALTAAFDNVMIAADLFDYGHEHRSGLTVGLAPIEDFAYPLGGALLLPALWFWWGREDREP